MDWMLTLIIIRTQNFTNHPSSQQDYESFPTISSSNKRTQHTFSHSTTNALIFCYTHPERWANFLAGSITIFHRTNERIGCFVYRESLTTHKNNNRSNVCIANNWWLPLRRSVCTQLQTATGSVIVIVKAMVLQPQHKIQWRRQHTHMNNLRCDCTAYVHTFSAGRKQPMINWFAAANDAMTHSLRWRHDKTFILAPITMRFICTDMFALPA